MYEVNGLPSMRDVDALCRFVGDDLDARGAQPASPSARGGGRPLDLDVAVPDAVAVILEQDVAVLQLAESRDVLELALRDCRAAPGESSSYRSTVVPFR